MSVCSTSVPDNSPASPVFTEEMKHTHTILMPAMLPLHWRLLRAAFMQCGYKAELLRNTGQAVVETGLRYVHNDICYPALLVVGQVIHALEHGGFDTDRVAVIISQTAGGCRASNYIYLLRRALRTAGFGHVPVISLNVQGMEENPGFRIDLHMLRNALAAMVYGDAMMFAANKQRPRELTPGSTDALAESWLQRLEQLYAEGKAHKRRTMRRLLPQIMQDFAALPVDPERPTVKVGIVGEVYIKYSALGNDNLEAFLAEQNCECMVPGILHFLLYCVDTYVVDFRLYGGRLKSLLSNSFAMWVLGRQEKLLRAAMASAGFPLPASYAELRASVAGIVGLGNNMGEGWLLTAEMLELANHGYPNIICVQPFGCLPNHIVGRGMINRVRKVAPHANILALDYDASSSSVNRENRIKLMLATARQA